MCPEDWEVSISYIDKSSYILRDLGKSVRCTIFNGVIYVNFIINIHKNKSINKEYNTRTIAAVTDSSRYSGNDFVHSNLKNRILKYKMNLEAILSKDQLKEVLNNISNVYVRPQDVVSNAPTILPPHKKLGVLVDYDEITDAKEDGKPGISNLSKVNNRTQSQSYSCIQCRRRLPTAHLLDLHIAEQHDLYFAASVERGTKPMYACYIEECALRFHDPSARKDHCIGVHKFPANYRFDQEKVTKVRSRKKKEADDSMDVDKVNSSNEVTLPYIKAFSFGHHTQRTFNTRKQDQRAAELSPLLDVKEMKEALNKME